jgi:hypothetical protein
MPDWTPTAAGSNVGQGGPQGAVITLDLQSERGVRLILEEDAARGLFSVTVSIPDWLMYARFFESDAAARQAVEQMQAPLDVLGEQLPVTRTPPGDPRTYASGARLAEFMARYP